MSTHSRLTLSLMCVMGSTGVSYTLGTDFAMELEQMNALPWSEVDRSLGVISIGKQGKGSRLFVLATTYAHMILLIMQK